MSTPDPAAQQERLKRAATIIRRLEERLAPLEKAEQDRIEPIAVVGLGCRFPGGAESPEAFWSLLEEGRDAVRPLDERWALSGEAPPGDDVPRWAGLLTGAVDGFDPAFFGIAPREARSLDPQHRLLLEVAWEALENAGVLPVSLDGSRTGVFVGASTTDYFRLAEQQPRHEHDAYLITGNILSVAAGRLSYTLGLQGACMAIDTACSSSLVALHLACQSLRARESDLALAGGVNLILSPTVMAATARTQALSPDGRCKTFDAGANGFVRGEGCGLAVLKRLRDAQRDGDPIWALIRGSAVNQDGRSTGLTAPNVLAQEALLRQALASARVDAGAVGFVETHGTGTSLGDPIEIEALRAVLGTPRPDGARCLLGAVKTNLGHLESAAGIAGLIKAVLALHHERIPRNLHFRTLNPRIRLEETALVLATEPVAWPRSARPRFAGVSAFGLSGTNAHVVLEEAPTREPSAAAPSRSAELIVLSARSEAALDAQAARLREHLEAHPEIGLGDVAFSLATTRSPLPHRLSMAATSRETLLTALSAAAQGQTPAGAARDRVEGSRAPKVVFVFPGQGSQWLGMGRKLLAEEPVFRAVIEACDRTIQAEAGFSLLAELAADEASSQLGRIDVVQPVLFAIEVALAALWRSWGVEPDVVVGHSMGEVAAAYVAGALSLGDVVAVICRRSRLLLKISGRGEMAVVELPVAEAEAALRGHEDRLSVAVSNSPRSTVLSGDPTALGEVLALLEAKGVFCRRVKVDVASHSPQVDPLRSDLLAALGQLELTKATVPMRSTVTGKRVEGPELSASYWADNLRRPVRFAEAVQALLGEGHGLFVEMSPHPILAPAMEEMQRSAGQKGAVVGSLRRGQDERPAMLEALGALWTQGYSPGWKRLFPAGGRRVPLPTYPWQRERHWVEAPVSGAQGSRGRAHAGGHPLLGQPQVLSTQTSTRLWESSLDLQRLPWLADHCVLGVVVFPGAGYLEMALSAGAEAFDGSLPAVTDVVFVEALPLAHDAAVEVQVVTTEEQPGRLRFQVASRLPDAPATAWTVHARGALSRAERAEPAPALDLAGVRSRLGSAVSVHAAYTAMEEAGIGYGPAFQGLVELWQGEGEALGRVRLPEAAGDGAGYQVHPALLDACFQAIAGAVSDAANDAAKATWMPVEVASTRLLQRPVGELWCHARIVPERSSVSTNRRSIDLVVVDAAGAKVAEVSGLVTRRLAIPAPRREEDGWFLELAWERASAPTPRVRTGRFLLLGEGGGLGSALRVALEAAGHTVVHAVPGSPGHVPAGRWPVDDQRAAGVRALLGDAFGGQAPTAVVHLRSLEGAGALDASAFEAALSRGYDSVLHTVQALAGVGYRDTPRLWLVTRGAQAVDGIGGDEVAIEQAPLLGLGRTIAMEHPEMRCTRVDLDRAAPEGEVGALLAELVADDAEPEIVLRGSAEGGKRASEGGALEGAEPPSRARDSERHVARLIHKPPEAARRERIEPAGDRPFRLEIDKPGVLDHLVLRATERRPPGPDEVEIAVDAAGLNFIDVMMAMGIYPGLGDGPVALGTECAGRIVAVGEGVSGLAAGQEVLVITPGSMGTHVTVDARKVALRPDGLTAEQAAAVPAAFMTAWYALVHLARLRAGERVLIHSATGGTGFAAVQIARHLGAEIFATAGRPDKRAWLHAQGITHVMDSRSLGFAEEVLASTGGQGVDVVLNSLSGRAIEASLSALSIYGRFIELGKTDIYADRPLGLAHFKKSLSYSAVDLGGLATHCLERFAALLHEVVALFTAGTLAPLPVETFPVSRAADAFRKMAQAQHIGKLVLTMGDPEARIQLPAQPSAPIRRDSSYLVTGGLGGLGLSVAGWLANKGAGHLVLLGRSGAASAEQQAAVLALEATGARVTVAKVDVADRTQLARILDEVAASGMPLRGVAHLAAMLDDGLLAQQTPARLRQVMAPKGLGALHLHMLTRALPLDFFVLYASGSGLFGSPGQANYAAANTFLDALAHHRRAVGLPALSVDWGLFAEVGLSAAQENRGARLVSRGTQSMSLEQGLAALTRLLEGGAVHAAVMPFDARQWVEFYPAAAGSPMLSRLLAEEPILAGRDGRQLAARLAAAEPSARVALLSGVIRGEVSRVLRLAEGKLDDNAPLTSLGMDSLMSLELRNRLEAALGIKMAATLLWTYPTVSALAPFLLAELGGGPSPVRDAAGTAEDTPPASAVPDAHAGVAGQDLLDLLDEEIARTEEGFAR